MKILLSAESLDSVQGGCKICFLSAEKVKGLVENLKEKDFSPLAEILKTRIFTGDKNKIIALFGTAQGEASVLVSLGEEKKVTFSSLMNKAGSAFQESKKTEKKQIHVELPCIEGMEEASVLRAILDGILLSNYEFTRKSETSRSVKAESITFYKVKGNHARLIQECQIISEAVQFSRSLVNENAEIINTIALAHEARKLADQFKIKPVILDEKQLKKAGCNLLCAVGQGAANPPRLVALPYLKGGKNQKTIALVGKGITFDSGGLNLKPSGYLEDMRHDMAGAAAVLGAIKAIASLKLKINVIGVIACAENAIGSKSVKPGDIIKAYNGKTVEILNTDAEGRLILADALSYTEDHFKPDYIVDIATLTGAVLIALGNQYAGLMTQDKDLQEILLKASEETDERLWPMPLTEHYMDEMKSDIADLKNIGEGRNAGTIRGAVFLKSFIKKSRWAHLDIAGVAWNHKKIGCQPKYASGFGVRLFVNLCQKI